MNLQHVHVLKPSHPDTVALGSCVENRYIDLAGLYRRLRGMDLIPPVSLHGDLRHWRNMRRRHRAKDYRNSEAELRATQTVASWTVDLNCELRNQERESLAWELR